MKRYTITLGATTAAGGKVASASSNGRINGSRIAVEDDVISCPACKSQGKIKCIEPRIPELWNGKKVALENDLCICGCAVPPRLIPNQSLKCQNLSDHTQIKAAAFSDGVPLTRDSGRAVFDDKFVLIDADTDEPMSYTEYAIRRANGHLEYGTTDAKGQTHLLAATLEVESVDIYL